MEEDARISYKHFFQQLVESMPWPMLIIDTGLRVHHCNQSAHAFFRSGISWRRRRLDQLLEDDTILRAILAGVGFSNSRASGFNQPGGSNYKISVMPVEHHKLLQAASEDAQTKLALPQRRYFAVIIEDLSELRRLERMQSDFLANISHELRTPLASVRLLAETLEDVIETDPDKAQVFVEKIEHEVQYLSDLVAELMELSLIESGRISISIEPVEAEMLVREIMARMLAQAQRHRVTLRTQIEQGRTMVAADSKQIARVLVNLVHNAIKFTPSGGTIVIGTGRQPGAVSQSFFVRDTGVGIAAEELPRVFERFYKVSQSRARGNFVGPGGGGSGLGLAIAHHVVEAHGGQISATSTPGQGSTFTFTLPVMNLAEDNEN